MGRTSRGDIVVYQVWYKLSNGVVGDVYIKADEESEALIKAIEYLMEHFYFATVTMVYI
jgi:hypothetical protein